MKQLNDIAHSLETVDRRLDALAARYSERLRSLELDHSDLIAEVRGTLATAIADLEKLRAP